MSNIRVIISLIKHIYSLRWKSLYCKRIFNGLNISSSIWSMVTSINCLIKLIVCRYLFFRHSSCLHFRLRSRSRYFWLLSGSAPLLLLKSGAHSHEIIDSFVSLEVIVCVRVHLLKIFRLSHWFLPVLLYRWMTQYTGLHELLVLL